MIRVTLCKRSKWEGYVNRPFNKADVENIHRHIYGMVPNPSEDSALLPVSLEWYMLCEPWAGGPPSFTPPPNVPAPPVNDWRKLANEKLLLVWWLLLLLLMLLLRSDC